MKRIIFSAALLLTLTGCGKVPSLEEAGFIKDDFVGYSVFEYDFAGADGANGIISVAQYSQGSTNPGTYAMTVEAAPSSDQQFSVYYIGSDGTQCRDSEGNSFTTEGDCNGIIKSVNKIVDGAGYTDKLKVAQKNYDSFQ